VGVTGAPAEVPIERMPDLELSVPSDETPVEEIPEYAQMLDLKYSEQLMSESMPDEDLPSVSVPRKTAASEAAERAAEEVSTRNN